MKVRVLCILGIGVFAACSAAADRSPTLPDNNRPAMPVASVTVTPAPASGIVGQSLQLSAQIKDANGNILTGRTIDWSSSDVSVASVATTGFVTLQSPGSAVISAVSEGKSGRADVTVAKAPVAAVAVTPAVTTGTVGQTAQLTAVVRDAAGTVLTDRAVAWTSSNTAVASVSGSGLITMLAVGAASITATSETISARADVTVSKPPVAAVALTPAVLTGAVGQTAQLTAAIRDASGAVLADRTVTWTSSNTGVASVSGSGLVTMVAVGSAAITATSEGISALADVTVSRIPAALVAVTPAQAAGTVGQTVQLTAVVRDASGAVLTDRTVTWTSSNTAVASVNGSGLVTLLAAGAASITATSEGKSGSADVTVAKAPVATVAVTPATTGGTVGQTAQLTAVVRDGSGVVLTDRAVTWTSSNTAVASVSGTGLVTMVAVGSALISATSEGKSGSSSVTVTAVPPPPSGGAVNECATPRTGWIFCDDFETDRLSRYFEYDNAGGKFTRVTSSGFGASVGMRGAFTPGQSNAGSLHAAFGRTPSSYFRPLDAGTANYRELYWRVLVRRETGWVGNGSDKLTRATIFAKADWSQAMIAHIWTSTNDSKYLMIDPASGTDAAGNVVTSGYNDFANLKWIGAVQSAAPEEDQAHVGQWACYEFHVKLNDAGQSNGVFEFSVNGQISARKTGLNWVGSYSAYGINAVYLENYQNAGAPAANVRTFDNFVISTQPIGCVS